MNPHDLIIERARPYLLGLPTEIRFLAWEEAPQEPGVLGFASRTEPAIALHPALEGDDLEAVLLHELIHLAEPLLSEPWVRALEPVLQAAIRLGLPPRDVPSLTWLSLEDLQARLLPGLPTGQPQGGHLEDLDSRFFPGRLAPFWRMMGVIPTHGLEEDPLYVMQEIAGGLSFGTTVWALKRLWPKPPMTRREAAIAVAWRAATALDEEWRRVEELLGQDGELFPMEAFKVHPGQLWYIPVPEERRSLVLSLVDAILDGPGEAYEPPEAGLPEEVVAGMLATGRL